MNYKDINDYELAYLISENQDEVIHTLCAKYEPIIYSIAKKQLFAAQIVGLDLNDLVQEGKIGLIRAIKGFSEEKNTIFYTLAILCIKRQIVSSIKSWNTNNKKVWYQPISLDEKYDDLLDIKEIIADKNNSMANIDLEYIQHEIIRIKNTLDEPACFIFELRLNDFSEKEITSLLSIQRNEYLNAMRKIRRSYDKLKKKLELNGYQI